MSTYAEYVTYFSAVAASHVNILHTANAPRFYPSLDEMVEKSRIVVKRDATKCILFMDETSVAGAGNHADNNHHIRSIAVFCVQQCNKSDYSVINAAQSFCEERIYEIIAKIKKDKEDDTDGGLFTDFNPNRWSAERVGPMFDNWYGYMVELEVQSNVNLEYNAAKWQ